MGRLALQLAGVSLLLCGASAVLHDCVEVKGASSEDVNGLYKLQPEALRPGRFYIKMDDASTRSPFIRFQKVSGTWLCSKMEWNTWEICTKDSQGCIVIVYKYNTWGLWYSSANDQSVPERGWTDSSNKPAPGLEVLDASIKVKCMLSDSSYQCQYRMEENFQPPQCQYPLNEDFQPPRSSDWKMRGVVGERKPGNRTPRNIVWRVYQASKVTTDEPGDGYRVLLDWSKSAQKENAYLLYRGGEKELGELISVADHPERFFHDPVLHVIYGSGHDYKYRSCPNQWVFSGRPGEHPELDNSYVTLTPEGYKLCTQSGKPFMQHGGLLPPVFPKEDAARNEIVFWSWSGRRLGCLTHLAREIREDRRRRLAKSAYM